MKKAVVCLCVGMLMFGLAACGNDAGGQGGSNPQESPAAGGNVAGQGGATAQPDEGSVGNDGQEFTGEWSEEMDGLRAAVVEALGENYWPNMQLDPEMLQTFYGIGSELYEDYMAETPMISANVDTLVIVKAKADKVDAVEKALNAYRDNQINNALQYPMNMGKVQASSVEKIGNYVIFAQLGGDVMNAMEISDEAVITQCQEANKLAIDTIRQKLGQ